jgi:enoyl-[acyl-carrier protein] reductase II
MTRGDDPRTARCRNRATKALTVQAVRRQPDHHAPDAVRSDRGLREAQVSHVVLAGGIPPKGSVEAIKAFGAKVLLCPQRWRWPRSCCARGADALVIEGSEAGGHIGPVATSVLAQEFLPELAEDHVVFVAGGIGRGDMIAAYLEMGASGRPARHALCLRHESIAHPDFKKAFFRANARDAVASVQVDPRLPVIPVRALKNKGTEEFTAKQREVAQLLDEGRGRDGRGPAEIEHYWAGALRRAVIDGDVENGSVMAGPVGRHGHEGARIS